MLWGHGCYQALYIDKAMDVTKPFLKALPGLRGLPDFKNAPPKNPTRRPSGTLQDEPRRYTRVWGPSLAENGPRDAVKQNGLRDAAK